MTVPRHCIPVVVVEDMEGPRSNRQQYDLPEEQERGQSHRNLHGNDVASQLDCSISSAGGRPPVRCTGRGVGVAGRRCSAPHTVIETSDAKTLTLLHVRRTGSNARTIPVWPDRGPVPTEAGTVGTTSTAISTRRRSYRVCPRRWAACQWQGALVREPAGAEAELRMHDTGVPRGAVSDHGHFAHADAAMHASLEANSMRKVRRVAHRQLTAGSAHNRRGADPLQCRDRAWAGAGQCAPCRCCQAYNAQSPALPASAEVPLPEQHPRPRHARSRRNNDSCNIAVVI